MEHILLHFLIWDNSGTALCTYATTVSTKIIHSQLFFCVIKTGFVINCSNNTGHWERVQR